MLQCIQLVHLWRSCSNLGRYHTFAMTMSVLRSLEGFFIVSALLDTTLLQFIQTYPSPSAIYKKNCRVPHLCRVMLCSRV
ncbi:unnamed protein product [Lathyrus oleraceus]